MHVRRSPSPQYVVTNTLGCNIVCFFLCMKLPTSYLYFLTAECDEYIYLGEGNAPASDNESAPM